MADATSSGSGSSGHSEGRRRIHPRTCGGSKPSSSNADPSLVHEHLKPPSEHSLGKAVELLQSNQEDRETAKRAVAIVLKATRKRGFKGAVSLCTEVTSLLEQNRRLERIVSLQRSELLSHASSRKALSSSNGSNRSCRRTTEHKANQIQPVLVNRSTSPLLKEVYVKSPRNQTAQTEFSSTDTKWRHKKDTSEMGCSTVTMDEIDENEDPMTKAKEKWLKLQEENVQLKNELFNVKNELESFKKKAVLPPIILESQTAASKAVASLDQQGKGKNILPEPPTQRQAGSINTEVELPHVPHAKLPGQTLDNKPKGCTQQQRKKGFRPFSSPVKVAPNQRVQRQPIRPVEMYAQCKCAGCTRALWEESVTVLCDPSHTTDKKSPKQSEILPRIGDHVVVRSHLTGVVKYIGPVSGEKQAYVGLHLDSPVGNHSGSVDGVQYFSCPPNYGALVPLDDILCITSSNTFEVKQGVGSSLTSLRSFSTRATVGCQTHKKAQTF